MGLELPNGANVEEIVLPNGRKATEVIGPDGSVLWSDVAIPDSVVSRPLDNNTASKTDRRGIVIETSQDWPDFGVKLSEQTGSVSKAYVYDRDANSYITTKDISGLSGGDSFVFKRVDLQANKEYNIVVDDDGDSYTTGRYTDQNYPYVSDDGNLSIIASSKDGSDKGDFDFYNILTVGKVGFD